MNETNTLVNAQQGIRILYAEKERASSGGSFGPVIRSVYILECCTGGKGHIIINGQRFPVQEGCCYALLPGDAVTHYNTTEQPRQGFSCMLEGDYIGRVLSMLGITNLIQGEANLAVPEDSDCIVRSEIIVFLPEPILIHALVFVNVFCAFVGRKVDFQAVTIVDP